MQVQIKKSHFMKHSAPTQNKTTVPSLFQIAAHLEDSVPTASSKKTASAPSQTPFAALVLQPEKLEAALKDASAQNDDFEASLTISRNDARSTTRNPPTNGVFIKKRSANSPREIKKVEFFLKAPSAKSVKLAADFTDWEKCPLDMMQNEDGVWFSFIPLEPGRYAYRFIVDGQWCDDPRSAWRVPNPFGTENALRVVT
jgi:Glycogen recognition site of AMP-activated protein kinase